MTLADPVFRFLALCLPRPGAVTGTQLRTALALVPSFDAIVAAAQEHGLEPLVLAHLHEAKLTVPADGRQRLQARLLQHRHCTAVRTHVVADVARAMATAHIPLLVLKGAALAHLVYPDPELRPMRDVDLLVRKADAMRAREVLAQSGFTASGIAVPRHHHHLQGMSRTVDGATVSIELHHALLVGTPFLAPRTYDDLAPAAQLFTWGGLPFHTLGCEDMLWHVYAHAFVINTLRPGAIRLLSVADLVQTTEAWMDRIDWPLLRRRYGRLFRALSVVPDLLPWSPRLARRLCAHRTQALPISAALPIDDDPNWSAALIPDLLWLPEWWFRMRYGVTDRQRWLWFRGVGHPAHLLVSGARAIVTRLSQLVRALPYSSRRATTGSTRVARRAGT